MGRLKDNISCPEALSGMPIPEVDGMNIAIINWPGVEGVTYDFIDLLEVCLFSRYHNR